MELAKSTGQLAMVVIHKSWCGACKALGPKVAASEEIASLGSQLVMVNVLDTEEPTGDIGQALSPDGGYIPRVLFISPKGEVLPEFYNEGGNAKYKYFYGDAPSLAVTMRKALAWSQTEASQKEEL